jgi:hypothetical protein
MSSSSMASVTLATIQYGEHVHTDMRQSEDLLLDMTVLTPTLMISCVTCEFERRLAVEVT